MSIQELYELAGSNYNEIISRLPESMLPSLLKMLLEDTSIQDLNKGIETKNGELAFRAAHTLKGVCLNLGLDNLSQYAMALTERLRNQQLENYQKEYELTINEYNKIIDAIKQLD